METKQRNKRRSRGYQAAAQVVYTQSRPFNKKRLILRLGTVLAIVLALIFGLSIFFKVETVSVTGVDEYMKYAVYEASGIREGDNLLGLSKARISGRILQKLPYVDTVQIRIKLPDTVNIEVTAVDITYAVASVDGKLWQISASGKVVDMLDGADAWEFTAIEGVTLENPSIGNRAVAYEPPAETLEDGAVLDAPTAAQRLEAALRIADAMEELGMLEGVVSIDVSDLSELGFNYEDRLQIQLGDQNNLFNKVSAAKSAIAQLDPMDVGVLDASYRIRPTDVIFTREVTES